jgi:hypothetical protein
MTVINFRSRFVRLLPITASLSLMDANAGRGGEVLGFGNAVGRALRTTSNRDGRFSLKRRSGGRVMKKTLITLAVGATVAIGAVASPTAADARWRHHRFPVAPVVGGLAAGALLGAALAAPRPYYDAFAYEPVYFGPHCYVRSERFWDGWRWRLRRVEDCY